MMQKGWNMDSRVYDMYLEELRAIEACSEEETAELLGRLPADEARKRLVEGSLGYVVQAARDYRDKGVDIADLIQEGNMAVMLLVENYREGDFFQLRELAVRTAMEQLVGEQADSSRIGEKLAAAINVLNEVTTRLAQELGRQATLSELAEKMQMSEDEVSRLMKTAVNAVTLDRETAAEKAEN